MKSMEVWLLTNDFQRGDSEVSNTSFEVAAKLKRSFSLISLGNEGNSSRSCSYTDVGKASEMTRCGNG